MSEKIHDSNLIWESGLRIGCHFGKTDNKSKNHEDPHPSPNEFVLNAPMPDSPIQEDTIPSHPAPEIANEIAAVELNDDTIIFPVIHFDFNNSDIKYSETNKLEEILNTLTSHPDMRVIVKGWCDHTGSISANKRISLQRANSVKKWLVRQGISPSRIESHGMGIDHNECDSSKARRAETSETKNPQ